MSKAFALTRVIQNMQTERCTREFLIAAATAKSTSRVTPRAADFVLGDVIGKLGCSTFCGMSICNFSALSCAH